MTDTCYFKESLKFIKTLGLSIYLGCKKLFKAWHHIQSNLVEFKVKISILRH